MIWSTSVTSLREAHSRVGTTNFPTSVDTFAATTPTLQNTEDSTGRVHSERHDDVAAAMMAAASVTRTLTQ